MENHVIQLTTTLIFVLSITGILLIVCYFYMRHVKQRFEQSYVNVRKQYQDRLRMLKSRIVQGNVHVDKAIKSRVELTRQVNKIPNQLYLNIPKELKIYLNKLVYQENQWKEFVQEYDQSHGNTVKRLMQQYPDLTNGDMRYLLLMKMGMNSNDICYTLKISERTLWNRRYRIKQKLRIEKGDFVNWVRANIQ